MAHRLNVEHSNSGELTAAAYAAAGKQIVLEVERRKERESSSVELRFSEGPHVFLTLRAAIEHRPTPTRRVATLVATEGGGKVLYDQRVRYDPKADAVHVSKKVVGRTYAGTLDPRSLKTSGLNHAPGLLESIPARQMSRIRPFLPEIKGMALFYAPQSSVSFLGAQGFSPGSLCRAACWGIAAWAAAACCARRPKGCAECSGIFGAVASLCNDGCPP